MADSNDKVKIGDKVMVRSNEDTPLWTGIVVGFEDFGHPNNPCMPVPTVKQDETGIVFNCMGIVKLYSKLLFDELDAMTPKDQWNRLSINYKRV